MLILLFCSFASGAQGDAASRAADAAAAIPNPLLPPSLDESAATAGLPARTFGLSLGATAPAIGADTLPVVLDEVWQHNPQVIQALAQVEAAGFDVAGAKTGYYPFLAIDAVQADNGASTATLRVVQPLWAGGQTRALVAEAKAEQLVVLANLNQARLDLGLQVSEAYLNVVAAEEQAILGAQYVAGLSSLLQVIQRRADNGVSPPVDVETAITRLRQAEASGAANNAVVVSNRSQLRALLNRPVGDVAWPPEASQLSPAEVDAVLARRGRDIHPGRQAAESEIAAERARVRAAKAAVWPQLSLQYSDQLQQIDGDFTPDSSTQLVVQFQSSSGISGYRGYQAAQQRVRAAEQNLTFIAADIDNRLRSAQAERDATAAQFDAQARSAESAVKLVDSFLRQFKVGRKAWVEVLNAQREAHDALLQVVLIKRNFWLANARLVLEGMLWRRLSENAPPIYVEAKGLEEWP